MKRIVLFSEPGEGNKNHDKLMKAIFPIEISDKRTAFMPSGGVDLRYKKYLDEWKGYSTQYNSKFVLADNSIDPTDIQKVNEEKKKILDSNILIISGGDPYKLLHFLRRTGLDDTIKEFVKKESYILAGFSAGAMILTPTIAITTMDVTNQKGKRVPIREVRGREIHPGLNGDLTGLELVDFEIVPHFEEKYANDVEIYKKSAKNVVKTCTDNDFYVIDK